jgi:hypothetical protein
MMKQLITPAQDVKKILMKLSDYNKVCTEYTGKASEIVRQLIFAGIAVIWLFRIQTPIAGQSSLDSFLIFPLFGLCLAAMADLMQYVFGGRVWAKFFRDEERKAKAANKKNYLLTLDPDIKAPRKYSYRIGLFYNAKIVLMFLSYIFIIIFLARHFKFN